MPRYRLRRDVSVRVDYDDRTMFGSPTTMRPQESTRRVFAPVLDHVERHGFGELAGAGPRLLDQVVGSESFANVAQVGPEGRWRVHTEVLYPDPADAKARWLVFEPPIGCGLGPVRADLSDADWPWAHGLVSELSLGGCDDSDPALHPDMRVVVAALREQGLVEVVEPGPDNRGGAPNADGHHLTFVGHNTVVVQSAGTRVIVDPLFFAADPGYPDSYQPLTLADFGSIDAVLVTHSHPDHFDPASLLRFPPATIVVVPVVERETILATAMARRLYELGFTDVRQMAWGESTMIGDIEVQALPFYGEQPSDGEVLHSEVRNCGNSYVVITPTFSAAFVADSGRDHLGDVRDVATAWREAMGSVDVVFSGYRGWVTYPVQLLFSSVAAFLLLVPRHLWNVRLQLMSDVVGAVDVAERWGARCLVPYADGGAPWHWEAGLGPRLDGDGTEDVDFDPFPDRVVAAAENRVRVPDQWLPSPVEALLLRPGDAMVDVAGTHRVERRPGHAWPYGVVADLSRLVRRA